MKSLGYPYAMHSSTAYGALTISGVSMHTPAWNVLELRDLWLGNEVRGQDRLIPGVSGLRPFRRRITAAQHSLPMFIAGFASPDGTPAVGEEEIREQLEANIEFLMANVVEPVATVAGTRSATLRLPSGATRTAQIHVNKITPGTYNPYGLRCTLDIDIPAGRFV